MTAKYSKKRMKENATIVKMMAARDCKRKEIYEHLGISEPTFTKYHAEHYDKGKAELENFVESTLFDHIKRGSQAATRFWLGRRMKAYRKDQAFEGQITMLPPIFDTLPQDQRDIDNEVEEESEDD